MRALIVGCGYVGTALGTELVKAGHEVWGLRRDPVACQSLEKLAIKPIRANFLKPAELKNLPSADTIIFCQAPSAKNDEYKTTYLDGTKNILDVYSKNSAIKKVLLISSTSVYAISDGSWVNEETDPTEANHADAESQENAKVLLAQEKAVLESGHPALVLRLSGIYGPGRNRVKSILEGRVTPTMGSLFMNRIHLVDIVRAIRLLLERGQAGQIYLGADDHPSTHSEFYSWLFEKLGKDVPKHSEEAVTLNGHAANKRVSNEKLKKLGFQFRFPSFREGYKALVDEALAAPTKDPSERHWLSR